MTGQTIVRSLVGSEEDRAVSPVIGVILMVAITVILAAVIAAFVLDIGPGQGSLTASADVYIDEDESDLLVVEIEAGGGDLDGVAVVDSNGVVQQVNEENANTGATLNFDDSTGTGSNQLTVYGFAGNAPDTSNGGSIDDADANVNLGTVDTDE